jgi:predicted nucleotidyltransferase
VSWRTWKPSFSRLPITLNSRIFGASLRGLSIKTPKSLIAYRHSKAFDLSLWEEAIRLEHAEREKERLTILNRAETLLADYFKNKKVHRAFLVGSILEEGNFYPFSDIDVLVEGLRGDYFKTVTEVEGLLNRTVDVIEGERCRFIISLEQKGRRIV